MAISGVVYGDFSICCNTTVKDRKIKILLQENKITSRIETGRICGQATEMHEVALAKDCKC